MSRVPAQAAALVGIGVRLPGPDGVDVRGVAALWEAMVAAQPAITHYPEERWKAMQDRLHPDDRHDDPWPVAHITLPTSTDTAAFTLREADVDLLSTSQILVLETAAEALADAGIRPSSLAGEGTGVYVASSSPDEALATFADRARPRLADLPAGGVGMLGTPLSRWLDARGPLPTLDTTCSSSAYALDAARRDLAQGRVDVAIVVGVNTCTNSVVGRAFGDDTALAADGDLAPYDERAHGYVRGEGAAAVVLVRHDHARRDHHRVYAVLEHTRMGADGRSAGVGMPSRRAQRELVEATLREAGLDPTALDGVVGHGTGTEAGDAAELDAFSRALKLPGRETALWLYSLKGLFGHGEGMAGLAGLIAATLMLHRGTVVATAGHRTPAPRLAQRDGIRVLTTTEPWPAGEPGRVRRVGVHCLGFSGAIGHFLVRQALPARRVNPAPVPGTTVLPLSATSPTGMADRAAAIRTALPGVTTNRMAAHLSGRLDHGPTRAAVVTTRRDRLPGALDALAHGHPHPDVLGPHTLAGSTPSLVWAFGGHGAAHPGMGATLYRSDPVFASHLDQALEALAPQPFAAHWHPVDSPDLGTLTRVQQATWAVQVAAARTVTDRYGLSPAVVIGHSLGEVTAAHIAGSLSLEDAARLVCARSHLLQKLIPTTEDGRAPRAGMVAARLEHHTAAAIAEDHQGAGRAVEVATRNAPEQVVFAASEGAVAALVEDLTVRGVEFRLLDGAPPAHSVAVEKVMGELAVSLRDLRPCPLSTGVEMVSTVTARTVTGTDLGGDYWVEQLRAPVEYAAAVAVLGRRGPTLVQEFSPRPVLTVSTTEVRARHALDLDVAPVGGADGPAWAAAHAYVHGLPLVWPHTSAMPVDLEPSPWRPRSRPVTTWADVFADTATDQLAEEVEAAVHRIVADLAPVQVRPDHRDRPFAELGLHSMDVLQLNTRLLAGLAAPPRDLPDHGPTIASVAAGLTDLVRAELGPS